MESLINLRDLFTKKFKDLPELANSRNCIYRVHNTITDKSYIGLTTFLYDRFSHGVWSHLNGVKNYTYNNKFYNSIRFYGARNFNVYILESNLDSIDQLREREVYWISYYNSFTNGYNSTSGGESNDQLWNEDSILNNRLSRLFNSINTHLNDLESLGLELTPYNYAWETTDYNCRKQHIPNVLNLFDQLKDLKIDSKIIELFDYYRLYGIPSKDYSKHSDKIHIDCLKSGLTKQFNTILSNINFLTNGNLELKASNYVWSINRNTRNQHIPKVLERISEFRSDKRWTNVMEDIFSEIESKGYYELT